jgi:hypothetical protein
VVAKRQKPPRTTGGDSGTTSARPPSKKAIAQQALLARLEEKSTTVKKLNEIDLQIEALRAQRLVKEGKLNLKHGKIKSDCDRIRIALLATDPRCAMMYHVIRQLASLMRNQPRENVSFDMPMEWSTYVFLFYWLPMGKYNGQLAGSWYPKLDKEGHRVSNRKRKGCEDVDRIIDAASSFGPKQMSRYHFLDTAYELMARKLPLVVRCI